MGLLVNGVQIPEKQITDMMDALRPNYQNYVAKAKEKPSEEQLRQWVEDTLIEAQLVQQHAAKTFPVPAGKYIDQELQRSKGEYEGNTPEEAKKKAIAKLQYMLFKKTVEKGVKRPTPEACKAFYDAHPEMFHVENRYEFTHLCFLLSNMTRADATLALLSIKGAVEKSTNANTWAAAVAQYSVTAKRDSGYFATVAHGELPEAMEKKLFALKEHEISDVIETSNETLDLFRLEKILPPKTYTFEESKGIIEKNLYKQAIDEAFEAKEKELREAAKIEHNTL